MDRIANDPAFGLSQEDLQGLLNPADYIGLAVTQTEDYVQGEAAQILAPFAREEGLDSDISL